MANDATKESRPRTHIQEMQFARLDAAVRIVESFNTLLATQKPNHMGRKDGLGDEQDEVYSKALKTIGSFM